MSSSQIVLGYDVRRSSISSLARAADLACRDRGHVLHLVVVLDAHESYRDAERIRQELAAVLRDALRTRDAADVEFYVHARIGDPAEQLDAVAEEIEADVVMDLASVAR